MLSKTFNLLRTNTALTNLTYLGFRNFGSKQHQQENLSEQFKFPNHKEFFNDKYYEQEDFDSDKSGFTSKMPQRNTIADDFVDPNNPFV